MKLRKPNIGFWLVLAWVICFVYFAKNARAEEPELIFEIGPSQVSNNLSSGVMLSMSARIARRFELTGGWISEQTFEFCEREDCKWTVRPQLFVGGEVLVRDPWDKGITLGMGPYWFQNEDRIAPTKFRWGMTLGWQFSKRWGLRARHFSTGGSGPVGCFPRDYRKPNEGVLCNDWNTGQDSWLRITYFTY